MKTYEELEDALRVIEDKENWTQGPDGWKVCGPHCVEGALGVAAGCLDGEWVDGLRLVCLPAWEVLTDLIPEAVEPSRTMRLFTFNDRSSHTEVVALLQRAIRQEKAKEGIPLDVEVEVPA